MSIARDSFGLCIHDLCKAKKIFLEKDMEYFIFMKNKLFDTQDIQG